MLLRDPARGPGMKIVVQIQLPERFEYIPRLGKRKNSGSSREPFSESCVLMQNRTPTGEKTRAAIAKPPASRGDVSVLGDPEIRAGTGDETLVVVDGSRRRERGHKGPAQVAKLLPRSVAADGQGERLLGLRWQVQEAPEFAVFVSV